MKVPRITALPFKVPELDSFGCLLEENVHNCVLLGWSLYFYSHKNGFSKAANRESTAHFPGFTQYFSFLTPSWLSKQLVINPGCIIIINNVTALLAPWFFASVTLYNKGTLISIS